MTQGNIFTTVLVFCMVKTVSLLNILCLRTINHEIRPKVEIQFQEMFAEVLYMTT